MGGNRVEEGCVAGEGGVPQAVSTEREPNDKA